MSKVDELTAAVRAEGCAPVAPKLEVDTKIVKQVLLFSIFDNIICYLDQISRTYFFKKNCLEIKSFICYRKKNTKRRKGSTKKKKAKRKRRRKVKSQRVIVIQVIRSIISCLSK